jgi:hypothetical protein
MSGSIMRDRTRHKVPACELDSSVIDHAWPNSGSTKASGHKAVEEHPVGPTVTGKFRQ